MKRGLCLGNSEPHDSFGHRHCDTKNVQLSHRDVLLCCAMPVCVSLSSEPPCQVTASMVGKTCM